MAVRSPDRRVNRDGLRVAVTSQSLEVVAMVEQDLWDGADVRWAGPDTTHDGGLLRPGDRAVVTDAGPHHITSFFVVRFGAGTPPPRPDRGVRIRLTGGEEITVPRERLELVPPDHPLSPEPDGAQAQWWLEQLEPWGQRGVSVGSCVPSSFPAVSRVLHALSGSDSSESDGELSAGVAEALVEHLIDATTTPDDVFVAIWQGWGDIPVQRFPGAASVETPYRGHFLLRGPLTGVVTTVAVIGTDRPASGLWWPADRAWFVATEIDFPWTFIAGAPALMTRLRVDRRLDVAPTTFDAAADRPAQPW